LLPGSPATSEKVRDMLYAPVCQIVLHFLEVPPLRRGRNVFEIDPPHRHKTISALAASSTVLGTLQELVGHSSSEITRQLYVHSLSEDRRVAVEKLEALVFGPKWTQVSLLENLALPNCVEGTLSDPRHR
jgi:hypothetical protein